MKRHLKSSAIVAGMLVSSLLSVANAGIAWHKYDETIFKAAKDENKTVLIFAMADACHFCHAMQSQSFNDKKVDKMINDNFYPVILHADVDSDAAQKYLISSVPVLMFFDNDGTLVKTFAGFESVTDLTQHITDMSVHKS